MVQSRFLWGTFHFWSFFPMAHIEIATPNPRFLGLIIINVLACLQFRSIKVINFKINIEYLIDCVNHWVLTNSYRYFLIQIHNDQFVCLTTDSRARSRELNFIYEALFIFSKIRWVLPLRQRNFFSRTSCSFWANLKSDIKPVNTIKRVQFAKSKSGFWGILSLCFCCHGCCLHVCFVVVVVFFKNPFSIY